MKINDSFRFPHPVLNETYSDFIDNSIDIEVDIVESTGGAPTEIRFDIKLVSEAIRNSLDDGSAQAFLSIVCQDTFFNEFYSIRQLAGHVNIKAGDLFGRVSIRAVVARAKAGIFEAIGASPEYLTTKFEVQAGSVLAWTGPRVFDAGLDKLSPMASIFVFAEDKSLEEGTFGLDPNNETLIVLAAPQLLKTIFALRNTKEGKAIMLNGVYLPMVIEMILQIRTEAFTSKRWNQIVQAKADLLQVDLRHGSALSAAQKLLKNPSSRLAAVAERL